MDSGANIAAIYVCQESEAQDEDSAHAAEEFKKEDSRRYLKAGTY